ncbi:hypothetical protein ACH5RR_015011 [Cinchona calisaya]|uniref:Uncharacterized protein n=1 Tax=Cinchona calisaya TaxID=153742 RepID=A0ABD2ZRW9_9GENT
MATMNALVTCKVDGKSKHLKVRVPIISSSLGARKKEHLQSIKKDSASRICLGIRSSLKSTSKVSKSWSLPKEKDSYMLSMVVALIMAIGAMSVENQLASMAQAIEKLTKTIEEKDAQIDILMRKLEAQQLGETSQLNHGETRQVLPLTKSLML